MQLSISGHHVDVTDALKNYTSEKISRLERHFDQITNVHVVLSVEKQRQRAEATVHASGADADDLYAAIDMLADKLDRQLIKHKEKLVDRHHGR
jgi:putative sigma-54 modulation protein